MERTTNQVAISIVKGRALVFDIEHVKLLRAMCILGVFIGTLGIAPQQSLFLSVPLQLSVAEALFVVGSGAGYFVDENTAVENWVEMEGAGAGAGGKGQGEIKVSGEPPEKEKPSTFHHTATTNSDPLYDWTVSRLQRSPKAQERIRRKFIADSGANMVAVSRCLKLMRYLRSRESTKEYFVSPGLKFGSDVIVYPGDPLRYHSHLLVNFYGYDEKISLQSVIGGGRLAVGVKKLWVVFGDRSEDDKIGGRSIKEKEEEEGEVDAAVYSIEWAGFG